MQSKPDTQIDKQTSHPFEINLYAYIEIIIQHRRMIGCIVGVIFVLSIAISLLLPKMYMATASILPSQNSDSNTSSLLAKSESLLDGIAGSLLRKQSPIALYVDILKSRSVADDLNDRFNLKDLYNVKYIEDVYTQLQKRASIGASRKGQVISVSVKDHDPQRAADMANAYVDALDKINRKLNITEGKRKRIFLEERLKEVANDLENAETALKIFQERYHLVSIEEQAKVSIESAAQIKGEIIAAQTELKVLRQFGTEKQIEAIMLKTKIKELSNQLSKIEEGGSDLYRTKDQSENEPGNEQENNFYIPFEKLPELSMQLMRLTREAKIQEKVFELLTAQFEIAQIEEVKDVNTIQILDVAVPPERKIGPKRLVIVVISTTVGFFMAVCIVLAFEYSKSEQRTLLYKITKKYF